MLFVPSTQLHSGRRDTDSPDNTPPSTPSGPLTAALQGKLPSLAHGNGGLAQAQEPNSKAKQRKRKKVSARKPKTPTIHLPPAALL